MFRHFLVIVVITHRELPRVHDVDRLVTDALGHSSTWRESCMGLSIWASMYTSHTGHIWACYLGTTWVLYGRVLMSLSICGPYGSIMGLSIMGPVCDVYGHAHMDMLIKDPCGAMISTS